MYTYICTCIYVCVRVCVYACMHAYMYVRACVRACVHVCVYSNTPFWIDAQQAKTTSSKEISLLNNLWLRPSLFLRYVFIVHWLRVKG